MSRYVDLKVQMKIKWRAMLEDVQKFLVKIYNIIVIGLKHFNRAVVYTLIVLFLIAVSPRSIKGVSTSDIASNLGLFINNNLMLLLLIFCAILVSKKIRFTVKHYILSVPRKKRINQYVALILSAIVLTLISMFTEYPRPFLIFLAITAIGGLSLIIASSLYLSAKEKKLKPGRLEPDDGQVSLEKLSNDQRNVYDDLKDLIENEQHIRSIGLFGSWGVGKTSVVRLVQENIENESREIIWAHFNPWKYTSQEAMVRGFYTEVGAALEEEIDGRQNIIPKLLNAVNPFVQKNDSTGLWDTVKTVVTNGFDSVANPHKYIESLLKCSSMRLIVVIDDAERSSDKLQINRGLQLVHELKIERCCFVFVSDKNALLHALPDHVIDYDTGNEFLEKFIEHELHMPMPSDADLRGFMNLLLEQKESIKEEVEINVSNSVFKDIGTYRGIIKVFNQFSRRLDERLYDEL